MLDADHVGARLARKRVRERLPPALVVVAESKADDPSPIRQAVATRVREAVGLPPEEVVLVAPGTLPKTSSGKLQRGLCRSRYLDAGLELV